MKRIYLTMKSVPELAQLTYTERLTVVHMAISMLPPMTRITVSLLKLCVLAPLFLIAAQVNSWAILPVLLVLFFTYPLLTQPISLFYAKPHLQAARDAFEQDTKKPE